MQLLQDWIDLFVLVKALGIFVLILVVVPVVGIHVSAPHPAKQLYHTFCTEPYGGVVSQPFLFTYLMHEKQLPNPLAADILSQYFPSPLLR